MERTTESRERPPTRCVALAFAPSRISVTLLLLLLVLLPPSVAVSSADEGGVESTWQSVKRFLYGCWQTATPYTDPNDPCTAGATGYRATSDCRGYVFCNDGYLMGGGEKGEVIHSVVPCGAGTLFDNNKGFCTSSLRTCPGGGVSTAKSKPKKMLVRHPPTRRRSLADRGGGDGAFLGSLGETAAATAGGPPNSASQMVASAVGGAGGAGPSPSWPPPSPSVTIGGDVAFSGSLGSSPAVTAWEPPNSATQMVAMASEGGTRPPPTRRPLRKPTPQPTPTVWRPAQTSNGMPVALASVSMNLANEPVSNRASVAAGGANDDFSATSDIFLYGSLRSSYYCAARWADWSSEKCDSASPCPRGMQSECPPGENCYPRTPCASQRAPPPEAFEGDPKKRFCGRNWDDVVANCLDAVPCPEGFSEGVCPTGTSCMADTPCSDEAHLEALRNGQDSNVGGNEVEPMELFEGDPSQRYCGFGWDDVVDRCLTATPCPGGFAQGVCPEGMSCIASTPCSDDDHLQSLRGQTTSLQNNASPTADAANDPSQPGPLNVIYCNSDSDCPQYRFCNQQRPDLMGYCGECVLSNGKGCSVEQVCRTSTCREGEETELPKCHYRWILNNYCATSLGDPDASCNLDTMSCEGQGDAQQGETFAQLTIRNEALYRNPEGNNFFCSESYQSFAEMCLSSKPCPGGFASLCSGNEGCFFVPSCAAHHKAASTVP